MIIEFDVFSGRPNPTWSLSDEQIVELLGAFKDLPLTNKPCQEAGTGYRGFVILNPERLGGLAPHIRICDGVIAMIGDNKLRYQDVHGLENQLLLQASQHGYKTIVNGVQEGKSGTESGK